MITLRVTTLAVALLLIDAANASAGTIARAPVSASPARWHARWDAFGHYTIAAIAYDRLQPATRARVDSLLARHPDVAALARGLDLRTATGARELFMRASVWPDQIRGDPRFYNEADTAAAPTPMLPGYPDMQRHAGWHYMTQAFSTDGTPAQPLATPNTVTRLAALARELGVTGAPAALRAYDLAWIIHIVGDLHQPLHGTSRASARLPRGDAGGNAVRVQNGATPGDTINLHAFWDGLLGRANRGGSAVDVARALTAAMPLAGDSPELRVRADASLEPSLGAWVAESETLARYVVYQIDERAEGAAPPRLPVAYDRFAESIARQRITLAGYRLAALLELQLQ